MQYHWGEGFKLTRHGVAGIPAIPKEKAEKLVDIVKEGIKKAKAAEATLFPFRVLDI